MASSQAKYLNSGGLSHFWDKIKTYVSDSVKSGTSDTADRLHFVVPNETEQTPALTASVSGVESLSSGLAIALRMPFDSPAAPTLNVNSLGAKPIHYRDASAPAGVFPSGSVVLLVYETESVSTGCFKAVYSYDGATPDVYQGATASSAGTAGLVPPAAIAERDRYFKGDGTWAECISSILRSNGFCFWHSRSCSCGGNCTERQFSQGRWHLGRNHFSINVDCSGSADRNRHCRQIDFGKGSS